MDFLTHLRCRACSQGLCNFLNRKLEHFLLKLPLMICRICISCRIYKDITASSFSDILNQQPSQQIISLCISESGSCSCPMSHMREQGFRKVKLVANSCTLVAGPDCNVNLNPPSQLSIHLVIKHVLFHILKFNVFIS